MEIRSNQMVKEGSVWVGREQDEFVVIHRITLEGNVWIHYRQNNKDNNNEYSCYEEAFVQRFTERVQ